MGVRSERHQKKTNWTIPVLLCVLFVAFTCLTVTVDRQTFTPVAVDKATGHELAEQPGGTYSIGFGGLNLPVSEKIGFKPTMYKASSYAGYLCLAAALCMAGYAAYQWIRTRSLRKIEKPLLLLMGVFALFVVVYVVFEKLSLNVRPFALDGEIEASYPSTHTLFGSLLMGAVFLCLKRISLPKGLKTAGMVFCAAVGVLTVAFRLLSGVHWLTDILGGLLLSAAVLALYRTFADS